MQILIQFRFRKLNTSVSNELDIVIRETPPAVGLFELRLVRSSFYER